MDIPQHNLYLVEFGPLPTAAEIVEHLYGRNAEVEADAIPDPSDWAWLFMRRCSTANEPRLWIEVVGEHEAVVRIGSEDLSLARMAGEYLAKRTAGALSDQPPTRGTGARIKDIALGERPSEVFRSYLRHHISLDRYGIASAFYDEFNRADSVVIQIIWHWNSPGCTRGGLSDEELDHALTHHLKGAGYLIDSFE